jgi:tetratricopeptide (TPR) repeat protein
MLAAGEVEEAAGYASKAAELAPADPDALAISAAVSYRRGDRKAALEAARAALAVAPNHVDATVVLVTDRFDAGDLDGALALIDDLLARAPSDRTLHVLKLRLLAAADQQDAVGAHLARMVELFPDALEFRRSLAQWMIARNDLAGAEAQLRALSAAEPDNVSAALDLVRFLGRAQGSDAARAELRARIDAAAGPGEAFPFVSALADLDYGEGRKAEAREALQAAIDAAPDAGVAREAEVQLARIDLAEGARDAAAARLDRIIAEDAANVEALALRGEMRIDAERPEDAVRDLRAALDADPNNVAVMMLAARAHERAGSADLAGERLAAAARQSNFAPEPALAYAALLIRSGRTEAAESVLTESFRRHPTSRGVLARLAEIRLRLGDWAGAEEVAAAVRRIENGAATADQIVAAALSGQGRYGDSIETLERIVADPLSGRAALPGLIANYARAGRMDEALAQVEALLAANPEDVLALLLRAELHVMSGEMPEAEAALRAAIAAEPGGISGYGALGRLMLAQGRFADAQTALREGVAMTDGASALRLLLAQTLEAVGDFNGAIAEYDAIYETSPDSLVVANNLASLLAEHRADDPAELERAARIAQRLRGAPAPALQDTVGWILFLQGKPEEALRSITPAVEGLPENPIIRYHAGRVYAALGQTEEARAHLEAALAIDPGFPKAASARETLAALPPQQASQ